MVVGVKFTLEMLEVRPTTEVVGVRLDQEVKVEARQQVMVEERDLSIDRVGLGLES